MIVSPELTAVFTPYPWQLAPLNDKSPVLLLTGSQNGGKSQCAAEKMHAFMLKYPGACGIASRKAREWCKGSVRMMLEYAIGDDRRVQSLDDRIDYWNGSKIYYAGMLDNKQRQALRSIRGNQGEPDLFWMEESNAYSRQDYEEADSRTRGHVAGWTQIILTTNPDDPYHWIYTDLIQGGQASVYYSGVKDNPRATQADYDRLDRLTGIMRERLRDGKWVRAEGAIYDKYDPSIHMIDMDDCPEFVRRFRVIDFGFSNPFVCQWWGMDADGRLYRYREIYQTHRLVEDMTERILELSGKERYEITIADHDAEDRATMERHGIITFPALKDVSPGIQAVQSRLKVQLDGKPRIYFVRGALVEIDQSLREDNKPTCTDEEITGYSWQKYADGKPNKEQPIKINDHGMDTTRYMVAYADGNSYTPMPKVQPKQHSKFPPERGFKKY